MGSQKSPVRVIRLRAPGSGPQVSYSAVPLSTEEYVAQVGCPLNGAEFGFQGSSRWRPPGESRDGVVERHGALRPGAPKALVELIPKKQAQVCPVSFSSCCRIHTNRAHQSGLEGHEEEAGPGEMHVWNEFNQPNPNNRDSRQKDAAP